MEIITYFTADINDNFRDTLNSDDRMILRKKRISRLGREAKDSLLRLTLSYVRLNILKYYFAKPLIDSISHVCILAWEFERYPRKSIMNYNGVDRGNMVIQEHYS